MNIRIFFRYALLACFFSPLLAFPRDAKSYLGIYAKSNSNVLDASHGFAGITVTRIVENSPGEAAGLKEGDIILDINGQEMSDPNQLQSLAETLPVGAPLHLRIERDKEVMELDAQTVARVTSGSTSDSGPRTWIENKKLGFSFSTPTPETAQRLKLGAGEGIAILNTSPKGPMARAKFAKDMIITQIGDEPIRSGNTLVEYLKNNPDAKSVKLRYADAEGNWHSRRVKLQQPRKPVQTLKFPLLFNYTRKQNNSTLSIPLLLFKRERLEGATKYKILQFIRFERGSSEELLEVEK